MTSVVSGHETQRPPATTVGRTISFIGNTEKKSVLELIIQTGQVVDMGDLNHRFADAQEPYGEVKYASYNNLAKTIIDNHAVVGAFEVIDGNDWLAQKSQNTELADAVAGYALGLSTGTDHALIEIFGKTSSVVDDLRSPQTRLIIFNELVALSTDACTSVQQLAETTGIGVTVVHRQVQLLQKLGLVDYMAVTSGDRKAEFKITGQASPELVYQRSNAEDPILYKGVYGGEATVRRRVAEFVNQALDAGIQKFTLHDLDHVFEGLVSDAEIKRAIFKLYREGAVKYLYPTRTAGSDSEFSLLALNTEQRGLVTEIARIYAGLQSNDSDFITTGVELGRDIVADKVLLKELLAKGREKDPSSHRISFLEASSFVLNLLGQSPQGLLTEQIRGEIVATLETNMESAGIISLLSRMRKCGMLGSTRIGSKAVWIAS